MENILPYIRYFLNLNPNLVTGSAMSNVMDPDPGCAQNTCGTETLLHTFIAWVQHFCLKKSCTIQKKSITIISVCQVVREACITVAFLSQQLKHKVSFLLSTSRVADPVHFQPDPDPASQNF